MQDIKIKALSREKKSTAYRRENPKVVPGIVYGKEQEPTPIALDVVELQRSYLNAGGNKVVDLFVDKAKKPIKVLFQEVQEDPVTNLPIHFDLYAVTLGQKLRTEVPIHIVNTEHLLQHEGVMTTIQDTVEVEANPLNLPESITVDAEKLQEIGDVITLGDLDAGKDAEFMGDPEYAIIKLAAPRDEEELEALEETADIDAADVESEHGGGAEGEEGDEGEGAEVDSSEKNEASEN